MVGFVMTVAKQIHRTICQWTWWDSAWSSGSYTGVPDHNRSPSQYVMGYHVHSFIGIIDCLSRKCALYSLVVWSDPSSTIEKFGMPSIDDHCKESLACLTWSTILPLKIDSWRGWRHYDNWKRGTTTSMDWPGIPLAIGVRITNIFQVSKQGYLISAIIDDCINWKSIRSLGTCKEGTLHLA
jgi:hypothetical protein